MRGSNNRDSVVHPGLVQIDLTVRLQAERPARRSDTFQRTLTSLWPHGAHYRSEQSHLTLFVTGDCKMPQKPTCPFRD